MSSLLLAELPVSQVIIGMDRIEVDKGFNRCAIYPTYLCETGVDVRKNTSNTPLIGYHRNEINV